MNIALTDEALQWFKHEMEVEPVIQFVLCTLWWLKSVSRRLFTRHDT